MHKGFSGLRMRWLHYVLYTPISHWGANKGRSHPYDTYCLIFRNEKYLHHYSFFPAVVTGNGSSLDLQCSLEEKTTGVIFIPLKRAVSASESYMG